MTVLTLEHMSRHFLAAEFIVGQHSLCDSMIKPRNNVGLMLCKLPEILLSSCLRDCMF